MPNMPPIDEVPLQVNRSSDGTMKHKFREEEPSQ